MTELIAKDFESSPGFCPSCGSILPLFSSKGDIRCFTCNKNFNSTAFGIKKVTYTVHFNSVEASKKLADEKKKIAAMESEDEGPIVDRKCPKCGNTKMSYATLQLRSADEGQTVFYTCTKCKFKESENS